MLRDGLWRKMGLKDSEFQLIGEILGREPNEVELGMFSVMWSEHCSYKNSRTLLKTLPTTGKHVLQGPGENAGILDIGDGMAVVFKVESHNHPSAIEPYQGAATGVGGIIRDIFSMGARPIASLNSLRFGPLTDPKVRYLVSGVVAGIAGYGNCIGIPTVGGEVWFDECYRENPLVNAMCVGIIDKDNIALGRAAGVGNAVILVGAKTGRDGMHGVTFASEELGEASKDRRPAVQVGDPFMEKLLLEACLELIENKVIVGIQDLGGAGLTCASSEMASRAGTGMVLELDRVPTREAGMTPYEIMLSESQERMLLVVDGERQEEVRRVFSRWGLDAAVVGRVTGDGQLIVTRKGEVVADIPARSLADEAPVYCPETREPAYFAERAAYRLPRLERTVDLADIWLKLMASPNLSSREWVYRQYDYMVRTSTILLPGADAAVLRIRGSRKGLALTTDCNARYTYLNPYRGGALAVAEAARNVACTGARPLAVTDCLNFGNPEKPEIYWQFTRALDGIRDACLAFETPVTGGNVSFYNESSGTAVFPTPVVGMVGLLEDTDTMLTPAFRKGGHHIYLMGSGTPSLDASEYLKVFHGLTAGEPPKPDFVGERKVQEALVSLAEKRLLASAHDLAEGGLAAAVTESAIMGRLGAELWLPEGCPLDFLFGEGCPLVLVSVAEENQDAVKEYTGRAGIPLEAVGRVLSERTVQVREECGIAMMMELEEVEKAWQEALPCLMES